MSSEYNSILISKLNSVKDKEEMLDVLRDIEEISDPVFIYPIYDAFKARRFEFISHYFLGALASIDSTDVTNIALEIMRSTSTEDADKASLLEIFIKRKYYQQEVIDFALSCLSDFIKKGNPSVYEFYDIITYLKNAGLLHAIKNDLLSIFMDTKFNVKSREYAFEKWLEISPKENLQIIIDSYEDFKKNKDEEVIVAKVINGWQGGKIEELKTLITSNGSSEARHIIQRQRENDALKKASTSNAAQKLVQVEFSNSGLVENIVILRSKVNDLAKSNDRIGFALFPDNEDIFHQLKTASDHASLMKACVYLRELLIKLNDSLGNYSLTEAEIFSLLPDTAPGDFNKSLNKLFLFLKSKGFDLDSDIFGLKNLHQIVGLLGAHPSGGKNDIVKKLRLVGLENFYNNEDWSLLHQGLLELYIKILSSFILMFK